MLLIDSIKFIHLLLALSIIGSLFYCLASIGAPNFQPKRYYQFIIWLSLFAMITGSLLVVPKHFTFHTPWIQAANLLVVIFASGIYLLKRLSLSNPWILRAAYLTLIVLLLLITHDAVTKTTFLFSF